ncbi:MAG TPA: ribosome assembly RNA-binding protein YhbY [Polyangiaceae bacterium]|jgi:RNA-binding protein
MLPKSPTSLSGKALRHLRALGHDLDPVIAVGKNGVTESLAKEASQALAKHELIKVRVMQEAPADRHETAEDLAQKTGAVLAQVLGRTFLLYKRSDKKPKIELPSSNDKKPAKLPSSNDSKRKRLSS